MENMERPMLKCPTCDTDVPFKPIEFIDASTDPDYKWKLMNGEFFMVRCAGCGASVMIQYPVMYMDPDKKLNVYMAPEHDDDLVDQLNSLDVPACDIDEDAIFRVVSGPIELVEKIVLADGGRDDRIMELYKAIILESLREDFPNVMLQDILYYWDPEEEYFLILDKRNLKGEELTVAIDEDLYQQLKDDYLEVLYIPPNKYAEVDSSWLMERVEVEV